MAEEQDLDQLIRLMELEGRMEDVLEEAPCQERKRDMLMRHYILLRHVATA